MPENSWSNEESELELDPLSSLLSEWEDPEDEEEEFRSDFFQGTEGRRSKAAFLLISVWGIIFTLHLVHWGFGLVMSVTGILVVYFLRLMVAKPDPMPQMLREEELDRAPTVSLLVAAKNEEAVIDRLVHILCNLDYPRDRYEVWAIDDASDDRTPEILDTLTAQYPHLTVIHRPVGAGGGKSGALNQVLSWTKGEIIAVFDADATVEPDLLRRVVPMFDDDNMGAVQVRKAIANAGENFWTQGQRAEMALDCYFQQKRIAIGGMGELRGNGQFVRRKALESCGGWNEQTITDDLDLTIRLHLDRWDIGCCLAPAVNEEGVTDAVSLWHQRSRWAEGGYQRYLDYWRLIARNRMGFIKTWDLLTFVVIHYILPTAAIADFAAAIVRHHFPILGILSGCAISFSTVCMFIGLYRVRNRKRFNLPVIVGLAWRSLLGTLYLTHWFFVMPATTARMSVRPKRLKWVKTTHQGAVEEGLKVS
ncbi:MAG: glycosyltransferase family 2 protein [Cyanobacteria bacterium SBLK]|nr:glycosyltransferase family 2 protein [Cyanobacteria bacterium SBLK]